jgi:cytochrome c nitrite reductase small subunit
VDRRRVLEIVLGVLIGIAVGVGCYTFIYAKGASYLSNDPKVCANCHIMQDHYSAWVKSSHRSVAVCNDCHTPPGFVAKYVTKANNGFWHSFGFTTGWFPDPLRITPRNRQITEAACRKCHADIVQAIEARTPASRQTDCIRCHRDVGHPR